MSVESKEQINEQNRRCREHTEGCQWEWDWGLGEHEGIKKHELGGNSHGGVKGSTGNVVN